MTTDSTQGLLQSDEVIRDLVDMHIASSLTLSEQGRMAFICSDAGPIAPAEMMTNLWVGEPGAEPKRVELDHTPSPGTLAWSPDGRALAFAAGLGGGRSSLRAYEGSSETRELAEIEGSVVELLWSQDGKELVALVHESGGNSVEPPWGAPRAGKASAPLVMVPTGGQRNLVRVNLEDGRQYRSSIGLSVWEVGWTGGDRAVVLASDGTGEDDWYHSKIAVVDMSTNAVSVVHEMDVQMTALVMSPDHHRLAFVEGKASDRGLTSGRIRILNLESGQVSPPYEPEDVTWVGWDEDASGLYFAGWKDCGTAIGHLGLEGRASEIWSGPKSIGINFRPTAAVGGGVCAAITETFFEAHEIATLALGESKPEWKPVTNMNSHIAANRFFDVSEVSWQAPDGLEVHGILLDPLFPRKRAVVAVGHGGPTIAWAHAFGPSHGSSTILAAAGYPVLLPNPRGSAGRGEDFKRANLGDLGGGDYSDITSGVEWCKQELFGTSDVPAGFVGVSYAGFLATWAAAKADCFSAVVAISTVSNWTSFLYSSVSGEFARGHLWKLGTPDPPHPPPIFWERSPIANVTADSAPTIILHGDLDNCTPVGQGFEFYHALRWARVDTELVIYPDEGHWPIGRGNQIDIHERTRRWFNDYLLK